MKPITLFFAVLLAVAGFGAGILVGRHGAKANSTPTEVLPDPNASAPDANKLPAVMVKSRPAPAAGAKSATRLSLAEIESALAELKGFSRSKLWERVNEIVKSVDPADIPSVMALLSKLPTEVQNSLRYSLLPRWAESVRAPPWSSPTPSRI